MAGFSSVVSVVVAASLPTLKKGLFRGHEGRGGHIREDADMRDASPLTGPAFDLDDNTWPTLVANGVVDVVPLARHAPGDGYTYRYRLTEPGAGFVAEALAAVNGTPYLVEGFSVDDVAEGSPCFIRWERRGLSRPALVDKAWRAPNGWILGVDVAREGKSRGEVLSFDDAEAYSPAVHEIRRRQRARDTSGVARVVDRFRLRASGDLVHVDGGCVLRIGRVEDVDPITEGLDLTGAAFLLDGEPLPGLREALFVDVGRVRLRRVVESSYVDHDPGFRAFTTGDPRNRSWAHTAADVLGIVVEEEWSISARLTPFLRDNPASSFVAIPIVPVESPPGFVARAFALGDPTVHTSGDFVVDNALHLYARKR